MQNFAVKIGAAGFWLCAEKCLCVVDGSCGILRLASPCMKKGNMRSQEMLMGQ